MLRPHAPPNHFTLVEGCGTRRNTRSIELTESGFYFYRKATLNKKVGWLLHGQEAIRVPDFNTRCQCQILGEGIGFLPDYMVREAQDSGLLVTRRINNPRQDSRMLLATQHAATGQVTRWIKKQFAPGGMLTAIYQDLLSKS